jgi:acetolactate synthase I/II/III large subunit
MHLPDFGLDLSNPDFEKLAGSFGAVAHHVTEAGRLPSILQHCITTPAVHVVEVPIDYTVSQRL